MVLVAGSEPGRAGGDVCFTCALPLQRMMPLKCLCKVAHFTEVHVFLFLCVWLHYMHGERVGTSKKVSARVGLISKKYVDYAKSSLWFEFRCGGFSWSVNGLELSDWQLNFWQTKEAAMKLH